MNYKQEHPSQNVSPAKSPFPSCLTQQYIKRPSPCVFAWSYNYIGEKLTLSKIC